MDDGSILPNQWLDIDTTDLVQLNPRHDPLPPDLLVRIQNVTKCKVIDVQSTGVSPSVSSCQKDTGPLLLTYEHLCYITQKYLGIS